MQKSRPMRKVLRSMHKINVPVLTWRYHRWWSWAYKIRSGNEVVGTVHLHWKSGYTSQSLASSGDGRWVFERHWRPFLFPPYKPIRIFAAESGSQVAVYKFIRKEYTLASTAEGVLMFPDGREFLFDADFWTNYYWKPTNIEEKPLLSFRPKLPVFLTYSGRIEIDPNAFSLPEFPLLVLFGCYLSIGVRSGK